MVATSDFIPALGVGDPRRCRGYVAIPPSFGRGERRGEVASSDFVPILVVGDPEDAGVRRQFDPLPGPGEGTGEVATSDFVPASGVGDPRECRGDVAILPSSGALEQVGVR